ncbi:MAG: Hrp-dependent type III effector protein [Alphaproteobacteria bacterium]|nr:Hrp-dependent type III effector protein [Alphaproteobacteria bacterium]
MTGLRLVADDLTGALDAAAPFAWPVAPVAVLRDGGALARPGGAWAWDAATRAGSAARATDQARRAGSLMRDAEIAFRKVDSMLRGHVAAEIAATAEGGGFASVVVAPAFPAHGRVTRQGRQYARADGGWVPVALDLPSALGAALPPSMALRLVATAEAIAGSFCFLCDAGSDADLAAIVAAGRLLAPPVLWAGSAGLARALAGGATRLCAPPSAPLLAVVGSRHPVSTDEIDRLRARDEAAIASIAGLDEIAGAIERAARRLAGGGSAVLALRLPALPAAEAAAALRHLASACASLRPGALFASGGDTLAALMDAVRAVRLDCLGEIAPGVPLSRIVGGCWNGLAVVSKSGGFAAGDVLAQLLDPTREKKRAQA